MSELPTVLFCVGSRHRVPTNESKNACLGLYFSYVCVVSVLCIGFLSLV
jgi:hypothetical protein